MLKELSDDEQSVIVSMLNQPKKQSRWSCLHMIFQSACNCLMPYLICLLIIAVIIALFLGGSSYNQVRNSVTDTATTAIATASHWLGSWFNAGSGDDVGYYIRFSSVPLAPQTDAWAPAPIPSMVGWLGDKGLEAIVRGYPLDQVGDLVLMARNESRSGTWGRRYTTMALDVKQEMEQRVVRLHAKAAPVLPTTETPFFILYRAGTAAKDYDDPSNVLLQCRL
jgi:hypothetical protein